LDLFNSLSESADPSNSLDVVGAVESEPAWAALSPASVWLALLGGGIEPAGDSSHDSPLANTFTGECFPVCAIPSDCLFSGAFPGDGDFLVENLSDCAGDCSTDGDATLDFLLLGAFSGDGDFLVGNLSDCAGDCSKDSDASFDFLLLGAFSGDGDFLVENLSDCAGDCSTDTDASFDFLLLDTFSGDGDFLVENLSDCAGDCLLAFFVGVCLLDGASSGDFL